MIASRIKNVLPYIIHSNQTGYVKDRYIGETVRSILDVMDFTEKENIPGLMMFIDFLKAFDTLEWNVLFNCLDFRKDNAVETNWLYRILYLHKSHNTPLLPPLILHKHFLPFLLIHKDIPREI